MTSQALSTGGLRRKISLTYRQQEAIAGWLLIAPWVIGFLAFTAGPMLASIGISLTRWDLLTPPKWIGLENYVRMLTDDPSVGRSLRVTTVYAFVSVPLSVILGLFVALLLNQKIRFQNLVRTIYYLPSVVSGVAVALLWRWVFSGDFGLLNVMLSWIGIRGPAWLSDSRYALPALIIMSLWGVGGGMVIYLAGLQSVPSQLYEAAEIDGANPFQRFWSITLPMISPVIFFQTIMGIIGALQVFTQAFIMTDGGPKDATLFFLLYLYRNAFQFFKMGYASALAWVLFIYILVLTLLVLRSSSAWVYYEGEAERR
jgi:multiple sugar transport system permease protein